MLKTRRQSFPPDLFALFRDDVHGHEHVQRVVHSSPDVLLIVGLIARNKGLSVLSILFTGYRDPKSPHTESFGRIVTNSRTNSSATSLYDVTCFSSTF